MALRILPYLPLALLVGLPLLACDDGTLRPEVAAVPGPALTEDRVEPVEAWLPDAPAVQADEELVCAGDWTLETQEDVAALADCTVLDGSLTLGHKLASVEALKGLWEIRGDLTLRYNHSMERLRLEALEFIRGALIVEIVPGMRELELPSLVQVSREVYLNLVCGGPMERVDLRRLRYVHDSMVIRATCSAKLEEIRVDALEAVGGDLRIFGAHSMETLDLEKLRFVGGDLQIADHKSLEELDLSSLSKLNGRLEITHHYALRELELPAIEEVPGGLTVTKNRALKVLRLDELVSSGPIVVTNNESLAALDLPSLAQAELLSLEHNEALSVLDMQTLSEASELHLNALPSLVSVRFGVLTELEVLGVTACDGLTHLDFLPELETLGESLWVRSNQNLVGVTLPSLERILHALHVEEHPTLHTLDLPVLDLVGHEISIRHNESLDTCGLAPQLEDALAQPDVESWCHIEHNAPGEACDTATP